MVVVRGSIVVGLVAGAGAAQAFALPSTFNWFSKSIWSRIGITGSRSLGIHNHKVSGDRDAFSMGTNFGQGNKAFTNTGMMTIVGDKVLGILNFNMTLTDDRYSDPQSKRIWMSYEKNGLQLGYGDLTNVALLNTNEFARYTKTLSGTTFGYSKGRLAFKALRSETKSSARTRSLQGTNTTGPYYIGDSQVINDSEEVRVDGVTYKQGQDYTINYQVGSITFVSRVIAPTSTIVVSYETLGFNRTAGTVQGAGLSYDFGKAGRIGLTAMEQKTGGGTGLNSTTQVFQGRGAPPALYELSYEPMPSRPIVVKVGPIIQTLGVDYVFGKDNAGNTRYAIIYLLRFVDGDTDVSISYTPKPVQTIDGNRRVFGFDYRLPLGKRGSLSYSQATGKLENGVNPMEGTARGIRGDYSFGDFKIRGAMRDVPSTFVSVESRSFNRNEKATEFGLDYKKKNYTWGLTANNSSIAYQTVDSNNNLIVNQSRYATQSAFVNFTPSHGMTWSLQHNRSQSKYSGTDTKLDTTSLSAARTFGKLAARLGVDHQSGFGPIYDGTAIKNGALTLDALRLNLDYNPGKGWYFGTRTSLSSTKTLGKSGRGNDITLTTSYKPGSGPFDFDATLVHSNSGSLSNLGAFQNGSGIGYGGNGFSGAGSTSSYVNSGGNYHTLTFVPNYHINSRASINGRYYQTRSSGSSNLNSESSAYGLGVTWDLGGNNMLSADLDKSTTKFTDIATGAESTSIDFGIMGNPKGPWSYRLGMNSLISGKTTNYAQDSFGFDGYLRHRLNKRSNVSMQFTFGRTSGYLPQSDNFLGFFYEHQLYQSVSLIGSYKMRRVINGDSSLTGAYRSNGFDIELNFNFGG